MIEVKSVNINTFRDDTKYNILYDLSLDIIEGEILGVAGESGSGKSVFARYLLGLNDSNLILNGGELKIDNDMIVSVDDYKRIRGRTVSMIFQDAASALNPTFTIGSQLIDTIMLHNPLMSRKDARIKAISCLREVEIDYPEDRLDSCPHQLSGGMSQRVMIALALATEPKYLIADESTTALDKLIERQILDLLLKLNKDRKLTIIFISHDLSILESICDRVAILYAGELMEIVDKDDMRSSKFSHPYTRALRDCVPNITRETLASTFRLKTITGQIQQNDSAMEGRCVFTDRCTKTTNECVKSKPKFNGKFKCFNPIKIDEKI